MISIIIPTYNDAEFLPLCLESVFGQTFRDFEIIVVNDGSTDNTKEILSSYENQIKVIHQENTGRNPARMRGYAEANGDYLLFLDSDIEMEPDMLENLYRALETSPDASFAYGQFVFGNKMFSSFPYDPELLKKMNYIHTSALIRRAHFPGFDPEIKKFQDWDVWLTMLGQGHTGVYVPKLVFKAHVDGQALSKWLPAFVYKIPWKYLGWTPKRIREYEEAKRIIQNKHSI